MQYIPQEGEGQALKQQSYLPYNQWQNEILSVLGRS